MIFDDRATALLRRPFTERQQQEAEDHTSASALVVHEAMRKDGDEEL